MHTVYALEDLPNPCHASIFLAGPTPRSPEVPSWRPEALRHLAELDYKGAVITPEPRDGQWRHAYTGQVDWEVAMRARADLIAFWVPRALPDMPAFTVRRAKAALSSGCKPHPAKSLQPEATGAAMEVTKWLKPSDSRVTNW